MNYHAALAHFPKITYSRYQKLIGYFSDLKNLWEAELLEIMQAGLEENIANEFLIWRDQLPIEKIMDKLNKENIKTVSIGESGYPKLLSQINDPPHTIFYRGILPNDSQYTLGIVGTRRCTNYGKMICEKITNELVEQGIIIISGLALGIDGVAHNSALNAKGKTIAVLGSGIDRQHIYPSSHKYLAEKIIANGGTVLSEYPPDFLATLYSFPARNRIIAGLSLGTLVIEAPESSGALITAKFALDYNRDVMAVPHPVTSALGVGCNNLIKMGAKLISCAEDVIETLNLQTALQTAPKQPAFNLNPAENKILKVIADEPKHIDLIVKETGLDSSAVNSALTLMEMDGAIKNIGGIIYIKK